VPASSSAALCLIFRTALLACVSATVSSAAQAQTAFGPLRASVEPTLHADARAFPGGSAEAETGLLLRRLRVELAFEIDERYQLVLEPGFGEGEVELVDGYVLAGLGRLGGGEVNVRAGRFKTPVGYESLRSSGHLRFAERALPTALSPRRDLGAMATWESAAWQVQAGVFNGVPDGSSQNRTWGAGGDAAVRAFGRVGWAGVTVGAGVGAAAGLERGEAGDPALADYETAGGHTFFDYAPGVRADGRRWRLAPQATLDAGRLSLLAEWTAARHRIDAPDAGAVELTHRAWQLAASYVLAGTPQGERRPAPRQQGIGAVEVSARVDGLVVGGGSARVAAAGSVRRARAAAVALQWSPTRYVRLGVTAERTTFGAFDALAPPRGETFVALRVQIDV
jgi:phosphate-selective porin OprO/OprP